MNVFNSSVLLLLLLLSVFSSNAAPSVKECESLTKRLPTKDLHKISGDWVAVWAVTDTDKFHGALENCTSSHIEFRLLDNKTIESTERNVFRPNICIKLFTNMSIPSHNNSEHHTLKADFMILEESGVVKDYDGIGDIDFYESCSDCLLMTYKTTTHTYLISYKREGLHRDVEKHKEDHDDLKKMAACLGFLHNKQFIYDGVSDFCHKKSAPEEKHEQS